MRLENLFRSLNGAIAYNLASFSFYYCFLVYVSSYEAIHTLKPDIESVFNSSGDLIHSSTHYSKRPTTPLYAAHTDNNVC